MLSVSHTTHDTSMLFILFDHVLQEEKVKEYRKEKRKERKRKAANDDDDFDIDQGMDPEMAALMGFSGFGGSKKSH